MKREELTALGLGDEAIAQVLAINGRDIEHAKGVIGATKDREIADITMERDDLRNRLGTAETTLKGFEGIDPAKMQKEIDSYKKAAEAAEENFRTQMIRRDQKDWIKARLDEYGVKSPYARKQLEAECLSAESGLTWQDGRYMGFDDYMKAAKEKDASLYVTAEEKAAAEEAAAQKEKAPAIVGPVGDTKRQADKYTPPKIF